MSESSAAGAAAQPRSARHLLQRPPGRGHRWHRAGQPDARPAPRHPARAAARGAARRAAGGAGGAALVHGGARLPGPAVQAGGVLDRARSSPGLKLNGHLLSRSPLSDLVEFEFIATAVLAKRCGFETLRVIAAVDSRLDAALLDRLIAQADKQHDWLADVRREVAAGVFGGDPVRRTRPRAADPPGPPAPDAVEPGHVPRPRQPPTRSAPAPATSPSAASSR